jgi:fumarate reductase flavoprotein subunit
MAEAKWWDEEYDVLVAGGGGGGLMAAIEAAELGSKVLLVEKQPGVGGATAMAVGSFAASGTALQAALGIEDTVEAHFEDFLKFIPASRSLEEFDLDLMHLLCEAAPAALERLTELGVKFSGPHPEPPHRVYRMHNVVPDTTSMIDTLTQRAQEKGVTVRTETTIQEFHREDDGASRARSCGTPGVTSSRRCESDEESYWRPGTSAPTRRWPAPTVGPPVRAPLTSCVPMPRGTA